MKPTISIHITPARLALAVLLLSAVAWAATIAVDYGERWVKGGGLTIGPTYSTANRITAAAGCTVDYDFPAIVAAPGYQVETPLFACSNVKLGDPCFLGVASATPPDGGSAYEHQILVVPIAKANGFVTLREYAMSGDGGAMNPPDAGYNVRCLSNVVQ